MYQKLKLIEHHHSLRLRPHEHTSYVPLFVILIVTGMVLLLFSVSVFASPGPASSSVSLTGSMPAAAPTTGANITSPTNGQHIKTSPITVSGTCPKGLLVEIYKNDIFAGSTTCDNNGTFSVQIDLLYGQNSLTAIVYDALNQAGPVSNTVTVYYDATVPQGSPLSSLNFAGAQFILITNAVYRGTFPNQTLNVPISILGGTAPFAINVEWGDNSNQLIPRPDRSVFNASHQYKKPGIYEITLQGTDSNHLTAYLQVAAIVNGQPGVVTANATPNKPTNKLLVLWPLFAIAITMVTSFWLGERREKKILAARGLPAVTPLGATPPPHT